MHALFSILLMSALIGGVLPEGRAKDGAGMILGLILIERVAREMAQALRFW